MIHYLIQVLSFQFIFMLVYELLLRRQTFFNWNRMYLLGTSVLSLLVPFMKISLFSSFSEGFGVIALPEVILGTTPEISEIGRTAMQTAGIPIEEASMPIWEIILLTGSVIVGFWVLMSWARLLLLRIQNPRRWKNDVLIISLKDSFHAFSFFKAIYLGTNINEKDRNLIIEHEMVHVRQWHSLDIICFQLLKITLWFSPAIYWYHKRMVELHEYIADEIVVNQHGPSSYYENLLRQALQVKSLALSNSFFSKSLVKKRIQMLHSSSVNRHNLWRYLAILPVVVMMLAYVSCEKQILDNQDLTGDLNLEHYSYTIKMNEDGFGEMDEATKALHKSYEAFLRTHEDYVSWAEIDSKQMTISYTVHHKDETPDFKYYEMEVGFPDGSNYVMLLNFPPFSETLGVESKGTEQDADKEESETIEFEIKGVHIPEVPYAIIDQVPAWDSCADLSGEERRKCTSMEVAKFVNKNFNLNIGKQLGLTGRQRISVMFKIDKDGWVKDVKARAPHPELEIETKRIISELPQFIPGQHEGETVVVPYSLPIVFQINE